jgi:hypothetical protein
MELENCIHVKAWHAIKNWEALISTVFNWSTKFKVLPTAKDDNGHSLLLMMALSFFEEANWQ